MQREELDQVRRLYRLFLSYERVEACADRLPPGERDVLVPALTELSRLCWRQLLGPGLDAPAHRRFVLEWCLRNVELLMKEEVLPVIAHQVVTQHIQSAIAALPAEPHDFSQDGPQGPGGTSLRRVYLIQSLTTLLARLALDGQIPARLQGHLTRHLVTRVRTLFAQCLSETDALETALPDLAAMLCGFRDAGLITEDVAVRLHRVDQAAAASGVGPAALADPPSRPSTQLPMTGLGLGSSAGLSRPVPAAALLSSPGLARPEITGSEELIALAAAGELMRRLRRQGSLSPEDRDRLLKRVETEMDDMIASLGPRKLDRALATLGERLGIPVPPPGADPLTTSGTIRIAKASPDTSDYQWAFDLIEDLRRDRAEPEGSSGK